VSEGAFWLGFVVALVFYVLGYAHGRHQGEKMTHRRYGNWAP
jgi:hypothetical protein